MTIIVKKKHLLLKDIIYIFLTLDKPNQGVCLGYPVASTVASLPNTAPMVSKSLQAIAIRPHSRHDWIRNIEDGMGWENN